MYLTGLRKNWSFIMIGQRSVSSNAIGSKTGIQRCTQMYTAKVPAMSNNVRRKLSIPYVASTSEGQTISMENHPMVGLKTFSWHGKAGCPCTDILPSGGNLPDPDMCGNPENRLTHAFYQELAALNRLDGLASMQQCIAMQFDAKNRNAKLISKSYANQVWPGERLMMGTARLPDEKPLNDTLKQFPHWTTQRPGTFMSSAQRRYGGLIQSLPFPGRVRPRHLRSDNVCRFRYA